MIANEGYADLMKVLQAAHDQASIGKGRERHANDRPFLEQPIMVLGRLYGPGFTLGQSGKKTQESQGMITRGEYEAAKAEILGAIVYLAATWHLYDELQADQEGPVFG